MNILSGLRLPSPVSIITNSLLLEKNIHLSIKRDELIHPVIQGNKWRKLKYNLFQAEKQQQTTLLSFGGAYSNHLHALAAIGQQSNFNTIGIIRGEAPKKLSASLQDMLDWGMHLKFISRKEYKEKNSDKFIQQLKQEFGDFYLIPEGGNNTAGKKGCGELLNELTETYDTICCEIGSGTMFSALVEYNTSTTTQYLGFAVMKNPQLDEQVEANLNSTSSLLKQPAAWKIQHDYHFGGFAKTTPALNQFIIDFKHDHEIQLEPVYSAKMLWGIFDLIKQDYFKPGSHILAIHGGGLQGLRGFNID